ncbi:MAG: hypothetical protein JWM86_1155 [Thermoleophilia bacterium]|nr:hypothetical protein [Thermoleophilia bacterium]
MHMGSVNANVRASLPTSTTPLVSADADPVADGQSVDEVGTPSTGFSGGVAMMGRSFGSTLTDAATFVGVETDEDGSLRAGVDPLGLGGFAAATAGPTALMALRNRIDPLTGVSSSYVDRLGSTAAANSIRVTPTLISAIAGPAIADGITMIAPNLVKKYKDTKDIKSAEDKKAAEKSNQQVKIARAVAGGAAVGIAAGVVFLLKPELFKKFGMGATFAAEGSTTFAVNGGSMIKLPGALNADQIRTASAALGKKLLDSDAINIVKTVAPMAKDAAFSNRAILASAGGIGTLMLANTAAGEEDPDRKRLMWGLTAAAGALTVGGTYGIGKLTERSITANAGAGGLLAKNQMLMKPNIEWIKKYATTIAPITAVPAGTAASQYFNIVNDFDDITSTRSPFRK